MRVPHPSILSIEGWETVNLQGAAFGRVHQISILRLRQHLNSLARSGRTSDDGLANYTKTVYTVFV